ncbi:hypothetical protein O181_045270 [Austropuccinia psidii MF-1]|uniref:Uncharacterized protein n=1 Tax=Austropuccinia psidii MF-1 TaxID=1389203 RepID=A0A9Q3HL15_9BASI|nr:hypothetical protein [Austropuccinia psidii MF-1]
MSRRRQCILFVVVGLIYLWPQSTCDVAPNKFPFRNPKRHTATTPRSKALRPLDFTSDPFFESYATVATRVKSSGQDLAKTATILTPQGDLRNSFCSTQYTVPGVPEFQSIPSIPLFPTEYLLNDFKHVKINPVFLVETKKFGVRVGAIVILKQEKDLLCSV